MAASTLSTPVNTISRDNLTVLIRNNILDNSEDFGSDCDMMETDSPVRSKNLQPVSKKLFHSPMAESVETQSTNDRLLIHSTTGHEERSRRTRKRKQFLVPDASERFKRAYIETDGDGYTQDAIGGMRKRVLISLFHNKEYSMDLGV